MDPHLPDDKTYIYIYIYIGFVGCGIVAWRTAIVIPDSERFRSSLAAKY